MDNLGYDAIVLAGGGAQRLGGAVKPQIRVGGVTLLDRVLAAVPEAGRIVVAGPHQPVARPVQWVQEDPPGGGPVAALAAALPHTTAPVVLVLAADLPSIAGAVPGLLELAGAAPDASGAPPPGVALLADEAARVNHLAAAWLRPTLVAALDRVGPPAGLAMHSLLDGLEPNLLLDSEGWGADCDTWDDIAAARDRLS